MAGIADDWWARVTKEKLAADQSRGSGRGGCRKRCPQCGAFCDMKHRILSTPYHEHSGMPPTHDERSHHTTDWGPA